MYLPHQPGPIDPSLQGARLRAAYLDSFVDMIPARFYLGSAVQEFGEKEQSKMNKNLDPSQVKSTSQLVAELARAAAKASEKKDVDKDKKKEKKQKQSNGVASGSVSSGIARNRAELKEKLDKRIEELKAERRLKQSEKDKANTAETGKDGGKAKAGKKGEKSDNVPKRRMSEDDVAEEEPVRPNKKSKQNGNVEVDIEAGRLNFEPKVANLPFGAEVNRAGSKIKEMRKHLRHQEKTAEKLDKLTGADRESAKRDIEMDKALQRARGEKVHDDISKLRKTQKHTEMSKKRGKEKWEARAKTIKETQADQQKTKKENMQTHHSKSKKGVAAEERKDRNREKKDEKKDA